MDKHARDDQGGIYYGDNRLELPPLNNLDTPARYGSTLCYASQVPLRMLESPPMSPLSGPMWSPKTRDNKVLMGKDTLGVNTHNADTLISLHSDTKFHPLSRATFKSYIHSSL